MVGHVLGLEHVGIDQNEAASSRAGYEIRDVAAHSSDSNDQHGALRLASAGAATAPPTEPSQSLNACG